MLTNAWETAITKEIDPDQDLMLQMTSNAGLFRAIMKFMFDDPNGITFVCSGELGLLLLGGTLSAGKTGPLDSMIWVRDWSDPKDISARINPTSKKVVAILGMIDDAIYPLDSWPQVAGQIGLTPSVISEIRCVVDARSKEAAVSPASLEATQLLTIKSVLRSSSKEKDAKKLK